MELLVTDPVIDRLATDGYDPQFGARPLRRAVQRLIEDPLSEEVLLGRFTPGDTIRAEVDGVDGTEGDGEKSTVIFRKVDSESPDLLESDALSAPMGIGELPPPASV